jgi:phosphate:Na+ symporter
MRSPGVFFTALVQSSSLVGLMTLALAGAGMISLTNAIAVLLGANLGTTATGWAVAALGFKLNLVDFAIYFIGFGGMAAVFLERYRLIQSWGMFAAGLGLLLFGLGLMKSGFADLAQSIDLEQLVGHNPLSYLLIGTVISAIVQSSSATVMITLSALNASLIGFQDAAAMVIGADLGTTSTLVIGSMKGTPIKRQLAMAHVVFNFITDLIAFVVLLPLLPVIMSYILIDDPLFGLVMFHSMFNLLGLFLFLPFIRNFAGLLSRRFVQEPAPVTRYIHAVPENVPDVAVPALASEVARLIRKAVSHNRATLEMFTEHSEADPEELQQRYRVIKRLDGQVLQYSHAVQTGSLSEPESAAIDSLLRATRDATYAAKSIKDIRHNLLEFDRDGNIAVVRLLQERLHLQSRILDQIDQLAAQISPDSFSAEESERLLDLAQKNHDHFQLHQQQALAMREIDDFQASTLLNINRELYTAVSNLLNAVSLLHDAVSSLATGGGPVLMIDPEPVTS